MKKILLPAVLISSALLFSFTYKTLHGEGKVITDTRAVAPFSAVELDFPCRADITVQDGATPGVELSAYENIIGEVKTKIKGNTLVIYCEPRLNIQSDPSVTARIKLPAIKDLSINGSSVAHVSGDVKGGRFGVSVSGSGIVSVDRLIVSDFESEIAGSGSVSVAGGDVALGHYEISGSGRVKAFGLLTKETKTSISGSGVTEVSASQKLSVDIYGSGCVRYKGHPAVDKEIAGSGSVKNAD